MWHCFDRCLLCDTFVDETVVREITSDERSAASTAASLSDSFCAGQPRGVHHFRRRELD